MRAIMPARQPLQKSFVNQKSHGVRCLGRRSEPGTRPPLGRAGAVIDWPHGPVPVHPRLPVSVDPLAVTRPRNRRQLISEAA